MGRCFKLEMADSGDASSCLSDSEDFKTLEIQEKADISLQRSQGVECSL